MTSAFICFFWQALSCRSKLHEGMICFYQAKEDLCVSLRWREPEKFLSQFYNSKVDLEDCFMLYGIVLVLFIFQKFSQPAFPS